MSLCVAEVDKAFGGHVLGCVVCLGVYINHLASFPWPLVPLCRRLGGAWYLRGFVSGMSSHGSRVGGDLVGVVVCDHGRALFDPLHIYSVVDRVVDIGGSLCYLRPFFFFEVRRARRLRAEATPPWHEARAIYQGSRLVDPCMYVCDSGRVPHKNVL